MVNKVSIVQTEAVKQYTLGARLDTKNYPSLELVRLEKLFLKSSGKKILEYGFGSGVNTIHLLKCGYLITAIDVVKYNKFKLMNKLNNSQKKKLKLDILNLKSNRLPYKNNSFDHIVAMSVISLLGNENSVKRLLSEFVRVLKPNGKLIIDINDHESEFSKNSQQIRKNIFLTKLVDKKIKTFCLKNISQFKKLISKYFKVIDAGYTSHRVFKRKITEFIICAINSK
tara:strand:- start:1781 stop:2461 length:681 start_codon:yes stop_codon:yes gene_type:complete